MARKCSITGKGVMAGNNVSHANNKTRRRFLPNLQKVSFLSETLGCSVKLRITTRAIRTIEHNGGLDAYLTKRSPSKIPAELRKIKTRLTKALAEKAA